MADLHDNDEDEGAGPARSKPSVGYLYSFPHLLSKALDTCRDAQMDFCVVPLVHPRLERRATSSSRDCLGSTAQRMFRFSKTFFCLPSSYFVDVDVIISYYSQVSF